MSDIREDPKFIKLKDCIRRFNQLFDEEEVGCMSWWLFYGQLVAELKNILFSK
jgi:hypothetical protein